MGDSMNKRLRRTLSQCRFVLKLDGQEEEVIPLENSVVEHPLGSMESAQLFGRTQRLRTAEGLLGTES
jgi:hypothetical protein